MCVAAQIALSAASGVMKAVSAYKQSQENKDAAQYNADVAELQAQDALMRGDETAAKVRRSADQQVGKARTSYAGRGVDVNAGTAAAVADQLDFFGQVDSATARTNAAREAWGYRTRKAQFQAAADAEQPGWMAASSLVSSAAEVASKWYGGGGGS